MRRLSENDIEKYSAAVTLSDMEIFVFPELLYSLVLANALSPRLWAWRDDPWFAKLERLTPYRRILRLKQYVMDHYEFNLDLDTWGLTTQARELARFRPWVDEKTVAAGNGLFGYEGDAYYFDLDIRRHFGLDKYTSDVIPYWKTETLEAMDAFRFKEGYRRGAGECVSLSTLYAAALFVVAGLPLEDMFLLATPLHSQNFILVGDGVLTNNRRLVTRAMWFNGTELSYKAQRALRHEQVTIVAHPSGHIHFVYPDATIAPAAYERFQGKLGEFLRTDVTMEIMANFLRQERAQQECFQLRHERHGRTLYIAAEKVYHYEHTSAHKVSDATREKLLAEIDEDEFFPEPLPGRIELNKLDDFFRSQALDLRREDDRQRLLAAMECTCVEKRAAIEALCRFAHCEPRLPHQAGAHRFVPGPAIELQPAMSRADMLAWLEAHRATHPVADLAFYAYRDLARTDWRPYLRAALERNPVILKGLEGRSDDDAAAWLSALPNESIYDGTRAAQPDEVWNYRRGDGAELALALAAVLKNRHPAWRGVWRLEPDRATLELNGRTWTWPSRKGLSGALEI